MQKKVGMFQSFVLTKNAARLARLSLLLCMVSALPETCTGVKVVNCEYGESSEMKTQSGAIGKDIQLRALETFTTCVRFEFHKLNLANVILSINGTGTRPLLQIKTDVELLRIALAYEYNYIFLDDWIRPDQWQHVCVVSKAYTTPPSAVIYLNGKKVGQFNRNLIFDEPLIGDYITVCFVDTGKPSNLEFLGNVSQLNIWQNELSVREIKELAECRSNYQGDVISWDTQEWTYQNSISYNADITTFCEHMSKTYFYILNPMGFEEGRYLCEGIGGKFYTPDSYEKVKVFFNGSYDMCSSFWIGLSNTNQESWNNHYNDIKLKDLPWAPDEPNGMKYENCGGLDLEGIVDDDCDTERCPICEMPSDHHLQLRGSCEKMDYDMSFLKEDTNDGFYFRGYGFYSIRLVNDTWVWMDHKSKNGEIVATLEPTGYNYPFGRSKWTVHRPMCNKRDKTRILLLSACEKNQFTCDDGTCIPISKRCDLDYDCRDTTDENDCVLVRFPFDYKKNIVPRGAGSDESALEINAAFEIETLNVDTNKMQLDTTFNLTLTWLEKRVTYINLKHNIISNYVEGTNTDLWAPSVYFVNTLNHDTTIDDELTDTYVIRKESENVYESGVPEINELFSGTKNPILSHRKYHSVFTCIFDLTWYPFDAQTCTMNFLMKSGPSDIIHFVDNSTVQYTGSHLLMEYEVGKLLLDSYKEGEYEGIKIILPLNRRHGYALINIYLPTLTLLIIAYLTLFFKGGVEVFETRIMTSLTTLLVMATLFAQFTGTLPKTSYFKMVDIWLLFCIFATFFIIVFHVLIDYLAHLQEENMIKNKKFFTSKNLFTERDPLSSVSKISPLTPTENSTSPGTLHKMEDLRRIHKFKGLSEGATNNSSWLYNIKHSVHDPIFVEKTGRWLLGIGLFLFIIIYWMIAAKYM